MTEPLQTAAPDRDTYSESGLNASDMSYGKPQPSPTAAATRMFILFSIPLALMFIILVAAFAWKLNQTKTAAQAPVVAAAPGKDAQIAQLQSQIIALQSRLVTPAVTPETTAPVVPAPVPTYTDPALLTQLSQRLDRLEANQRALARAAAAANAAAALQLKAHSSEPFLNELAAVEPAFADPALTAPLRAVAERGVPSETQLAIEFPQAAAKANIAAKAAGDEASLFDRARHALGSFISVRRTDNLNGKGVQAVLVRAETRLNQGDLKGALAYLDTLPPEAQKALKPWLDKARARALVDGTTLRLTQLTLQKLAKSSDTGAAL
jgi:hypothetical protein